MIEDLYQYYKNNLTFESIVIGKNGFLKNSLFYFSFIAFICLIAVYLLTQDDIWGVVAFIVAIVSAIVGRYTFANMIKRNYPNYYISRFDWSTSGLNGMYLDSLENHLKNIDDNKLDIIQELIKERANRSRIPSIVAISTFVALVVPLWNAYISAIMDSLKKEGFVAMGFAFIIFLGLIIALSGLSLMFTIARDNLLTRYMSWNRLNNLISEMRLRKK